VGNFHKADYRDSTETQGKYAGNKQQKKHISRDNKKKSVWFTLYVKWIKKNNFFLYICQCVLNQLSLHNYTPRKRKSETKWDKCVSVRANSTPQLNSAICYQFANTTTKMSITVGK
jgi:hypothetical protein